MTEPPIDPAGEPGFEEEAVDGIPVVAEVRAIETSSVSAVPALQTAAAAATGFLAGAATLAVVRRSRSRKTSRLQRRATRRQLDMLPVLGTRTFLVDVHLIGKPPQ